MPNQQDLTDRFVLEYNADQYRRVIAGKEVVLHCHHYNSRLQQSIEGVSQIDGKAIIRSAAEYVFDDHVRRAFRPGDSAQDKFAVAQRLYAHLGFGMLDFSTVGDGVVTASTAHFVEGWNAIFGRRDEPICTFTEGYLQGAIHAVTGETVSVRETACLISGHDECRFAVHSDRETPFAEFPEIAFQFTAKDIAGFARSDNVDEQAIIDAVVGMPIYGDDEGLIPTFSVYLACMPSDFYNLACFTFVQTMEARNLHSTAKNMLIYCGEVCGTATFQGIMASEEWAGLVAPMIKQPSDNIFALVAISNAFGWGNWHVREHEPYQTLAMESLNGYEALGHRSRLGDANEPRCFMLTGVSAGLMELIYSTGTIADRFGTFLSDEKECICCDHESCEFDVEAA